MIRISFYELAFFLAASVALFRKCQFPPPPPKGFKSDLPKVSIGPNAVPLPQIDSKGKLGKTLFKNSCAACHNKNMRDDLTGPALGGVAQEWEAYNDGKDIYRWIRNSQKLVEEEHPRGKKIFEDYNGTIMPPNNLTDEEIDAVLYYIDLVYDGVN